MTFLIGAVMAGIALFVTYASVNGVGSMFPSTGYAVMLAWLAVEVGKYAALGFALRQWTGLSTPLRAALSGFIGFIMILTSVSVYAYLGQSYAATSATVGRNTLELDTKTAQATELRARVAAIDRQIAEIPATATSARIRLIQQYDAERKPLAERATALDGEIVTLRTGNADAESHVGIIKFLANAASVSVERATMWAILAVTLCLDPFAMLLNALLNRSRANDAREEAEALALRASTRYTEPPPPRRWSAEEIRDRKIEAEARERRKTAEAPDSNQSRSDYFEAVRKGFNADYATWWHSLSAESQLKLLAEYPTYDPPSEPQPETDSEVEESRVIAHMAATLNPNETQDEAPDGNRTTQHRVLQTRPLQVHEGSDVRDGEKFAASGPPSV